MDPRHSDLLARQAEFRDKMHEYARRVEAEGRDFNDDEAREWRELCDSERTLAAQIARRQQLDALDRTAAAGEGGASEWRGMMDRWSLFRAACAATGDSTPDAAVEREVSAEIARRRGRQPRGIFLPSEATHVRAEYAPREVRASAYLTTGAAGPIVPTGYRPDQYVDLLRPGLLTARLGVRVLSGLEGFGKITIPRALTGHSVVWLAEDSAVPQARAASTG